jgi:hypothetical protein
MVGGSLEINWDASAELYWQVKRSSKMKRKKRSARRRILTATLQECIRRLVARRPNARPQYSIRVSDEAGIAKTRLDYLDAQALAWRVDYPE